MQWASAPEGALKAMGHEGHLWKTSQWAVCMCVFTAFRLFTPPNTKWQQGHLQWVTGEIKKKLIQLSFHRMILASFIACVDTCIRGDASSACRIDSGVCWGYEADRWHRILGRPEETAADVTGDEPQHCTSSTEAWEENTACNTAQRDSYLVLKTMIFVITTHQWPQM